MFSYLCLLLNELAYFKVRCTINHTNLHSNQSIPESVLIMVITMFTKYQTLSRQLEVHETLSPRDS